MRTPEQIAADDALTAAIENVVVAHFGYQPGAVVGDYAIVFHRSWIDEDNEVDGRVGYLTRDDALDAYRFRGLMGEALLSLDTRD